MLYDRSYGIEIEAIAPATLVNRFESVAAALTQAGVEAHASNYHSARAATAWVVKPDGSLGSGGLEVASPSAAHALRGEEGYAQIRTVCRVLQELGLRVNSSCGLHVHVDARLPEFRVEAARKLTVLYAQNEPVIDSLMPPSRRGARNRYARSLASIDVARVAAQQSLTNLTSLLGGRYVKLNLNAIWAHGTIEFRQHSGTIEAQKIIRWVQLCLRMVDKSVADPTIAPGVARRRRVIRGRKATYITMVTSPQGCTREEVHAATGWRGNIGLHAMAREAGLDLRSARVEGRGLVWYGAPSVTVTGAERPSVEGLAALLEMTDEERDHWLARARHFTSNQEEAR